MIIVTPQHMVTKARGALSKARGIPSRAGLILELEWTKNKREANDFLMRNAGEINAPDMVLKNGAP